MATAEAAKRLDVHPATVQRWFDDRLLDGYKLPSGVRRIYVDSIERMLAERTAS